MYTPTAKEIPTGRMAFLFALSKYAIKKMTAFLKYKFPQIKFTEIAKLTNMSPYAISKIWHEKIEIEDEYAQVVKAGRSVKSVRNIQV